MGATGMVIPAEKRYGRLKEIVFWLADSLVALRTKRNELFSAQMNNLLSLTYPWLAIELNPDDAQEKILAQSRHVLSEQGFQGEKVLAELRDVLAGDEHLAACCLTPLRLAQYLDSSVVRQVAAEKQAGATQDGLESAYEEFEASTYRMGPFKRTVLSHLFNFEMEGNSTTIDEVRIERLTPDTIPRIIGEPGFQAFLHPSRAGDCFIVAEDTASQVTDFEWMRSQREKAILFGNLLQFYKDGVVHVGYSAIHFSPEWVNQVRKPPLFFLGTPRQVPYQNGSRKWTMMTPDREELLRWWLLMKTPQIAAKLENRSGKLREAIYRAGTYFDESHQKVGSTERLITLAIALESLLSPDDKENLSFRISLAAAQFVASDPVERTRIFESLREMYRKRSKLFHGTYDVKKYENGTFVTDDEISEWASYIRRSLLGFLSLHLRGENSRETVLSQIERAHLDPVQGEDLRKKADVYTLVDELFPKIAQMR